MSLRSQADAEMTTKASTVTGRVSGPPIPDSATQLPLIPFDIARPESETVHRVFRPIHYLGSKLRMVGAVVDAIDKVDPNRGRVCDLFAGSGTVSAMLAQSRSVTAFDIQEYSRVLCSALLNPVAMTESHSLNLEPVETSNLAYATASIVAYEDECIKLASEGDSDYLNDFLENGSLTAFLSGECEGNQPLRDALRETAGRLKEVGLYRSSSSLTVRMFGGVYFSYSQAVQLDALLDAVFSFPSRQRDVLLAAVLSTASEVVNTVGKHFAQPIRPRDKQGLTKRNLLNKIQKDRSADVPAIFGRWLKRYQAVIRTSRPHHVLRADYVDALSSLTNDVRVVYADPPYTRDHYSRYYHVLETLSLRDNPAVARVRVNGVERISRGVYRVDRHQSPFCIRSQAASAFSELFKGVAQKQVPLVLSYSPYASGSDARPRVLIIDDIVSLAREEFGQVIVETAGPFSHNKLNNSRLNKLRTYNAESLIICRP